MKVTLIAPTQGNRGFDSLAFYKIPPLNLYLLASMTPGHWDVEIIEESEQEIDFNQETDLVGLTATTSMAPRAYAIADEFRNRGIKTIIGGIHSSMLPGEAINHTDCVVIGEADHIWADVLNDFELGRLKKIYRPPLPPDLNQPCLRKRKRTFPVLFSTLLPYKFKIAYFETQRGCPNDCDFCVISRFNGTNVRTREISGLIKEIRNEIENEGAHYIGFIDNNFLSKKAYAKKIMEEMKKIRIRWLCQSDIRIADDDIISTAAESGLSGVLIGFESLNTKTLNSVSKTKRNWHSRYRDAITKLHDHGIFIQGAFILGFDEDDNDTIEFIIDWVKQNKIDIVQMTILTPTPGTRIYQKMLEENRIKDYNWSHYDVLNCVYEPKNWDGRQLEEELKKAYRRCYSWPSILKRTNKLNLFSNTFSFLTNVELHFFFKT